MLHMPFTSATPSRTTIQLPPVSTLPSFNVTGEPYSDSRFHGYRGPSRNVTLPNASSSGSSTISRSQDGERCVVAGKDSLRILRVTSPNSARSHSEHKVAIGKGGYKIDASRNMCATSGLKIDSALTDVTWCKGAFENKILTSARNGEIIMWDLQKSGTSKLERRSKQHTRAINKISYSTVFPYYCGTGSSDGNFRLWDIRDLQKSTFYIHHTSQIRTIMLSPSILSPLHAVTGLDDGTICRWDLRMGQKGLIDRIPLAHSRPVLSFDWCDPHATGDSWLASAGFDRTVNIWNFSPSSETNPSSTHGGRKPLYTLHPSFPVRRVAWRPGYETELAIASSNEHGYSTSAVNPSMNASTHSNKEVAEIVNLTGHTGSSPGSSGSADSAPGSSNASTAGSENAMSTGRNVTIADDMIEVWDVRRAWVAKWTLSGSSRDGGVTDLTFADSHALWVQHPSGAFSQMDLRCCDKPIDSVPRTAITWNAFGSMTFVADQKSKWEIPYDDIDSALPESEFNKRLGDESFVASTQVVGTVAGFSNDEDLESFVQLARGYRLEREMDKTELCEINAEVAFGAGQYSIGQIWLLLQSLLIDIIPKRVPERSPAHPTLPHSSSAPAGVPLANRPPSQRAPIRSSSSDSPSTRVAKVSPHRADSSGRSDTPLLSHSSSTGGLRSSSSPLSINSGSVPSSRAGHKSTPSVPHVRPRRHSLRRTSLSSITMQSEVDDRAPGISKLRRPGPIGEGALDDDSSSSDDEALSGLNGSSQKGIASGHPDTLSLSGIGSSSRQLDRSFVSSPLTRDDDWAEDEKEDSTSPRSSETESDDSTTSTKPARSSSAGRHTRSRSSVSASLAVPSHDRKHLLKQDSKSSIRTVIATEKLGSSENSRSRSPDAEIVTKTPSRAPHQEHNRRRSQVLSGQNSMAQPVCSEGPSEGYVMDESEMRFLQWNGPEIKEAEDMYRQAVWSGLKEVFQDKLHHGDVQTCAMMACVASKELDITPFLTLRLVEAYIDFLCRIRLFSVAAYVRKHSDVSDVRKTSELQTTVYTVCQRCLKPIVQPTTTFSRVNGEPRIGFHYCMQCKKSIYKCAICHLPVKASLFVCTGCSHGGHQECYRKYYTSRPLVEVVTSNSNSRGHTPQHEYDEPVAEMRKLFGHACVTGCGHTCWTLTTDEYVVKSA